MRIDHIGYAVEDIEKAKKKLSGLGYVFEEVIEDLDRNVDLCFGELDGYRIELVAPGKQDDRESPIDDYLNAIGPTPYHICYKSKDLEKDIEKLQTLRFRVSVPVASAVAFGGRQVVFMYSLSAGLIEIVEEN